MEILSVKEGKMEKFFKGKLECDCGYVTHYNGELIKAKKKYIDQFCSVCEKHYLINGSRFSKALSQYMKDYSYSIRGIALDANATRITVFRWLNGRRQKERPNSVVIYFAHPNWEHIISLMKNGHKDFILDCLNKGII